MPKDNGKKAKVSDASPVSKNGGGNGSMPYSRYVQKRLEIEYGISYNPKLVKEISDDLEEMNNTIRKLVSEGKLSLFSIG